MHSLLVCSRESGLSSYATHVRGFSKSLAKLEGSEKINEALFYIIPKEGNIKYSYKQTYIETPQIGFQISRQNFEGCRLSSSILSN